MPASTVNGHLQIRYHRSRADSGTQLTVLRQEPPLRVLRAFETGDGAAFAHLHNISGGVLGGDQLRVDVTVEAQANAQLTTTGATRIYRHRFGFPEAAQTTQLLVRTGGLLEFLPDPVIPFAASRYCQATRIELDDGAGLFYWEVVAPGRGAHGEVFAFDHLRLDLDIIAGGKPILIERMNLEPHLRDLRSPVRLGAYGYYGSFYICHVGTPPSDWLSLESALAQLTDKLSTPGHVLWGVSCLPAHGVVVRVLSTANRFITAALPCFWQVAKQKLYGSAAIAPRKVN